VDLLWDFKVNVALKAIGAPKIAFNSTLTLRIARAGPIVP
jgi:hypothetical protein